MLYAMENMTVSSNRRCEAVELCIVQSHRLQAYWFSGLILNIVVAPLQLSPEDAPEVC